MNVLPNRSYFLLWNYLVKTPTIAIFLNVAKAFDKVWQGGLICKLIDLGIHAVLIHLIHSYLSDHNFCFHTSNILCTLYLILSGILKVSVIGTTLLNIFLSDISSTLRTFIVLYAEDTKIHSSEHHLYITYTLKFFLIQKTPKSHWHFHKLVYLVAC